MTMTKPTIDPARAEVPWTPHGFFSRHANRPWAIHGPALAVLARSILPAEAAQGRGDRRAARGGDTIEDWREALAYYAPQRQPLGLDRDSGIAVLDVRGALVDDDGPIWVAALGMTTWRELQRDIAGLRQSAAVRGVFVTVDSPGGMCAGCADTAGALAELARSMPVLVHAQSYLASAAYALAAGVTEIWAESSALVGCIGTIIPLLDVSKYWDEFGVKDDYVTNTGGDLKATGYPPSQTPEERAQLQIQCDDFAAQFIGHVLAHRNLTSDTMRGQCFVAEPRGREANVVDRIGSRAEAFTRLRQMVG